MPTSFNDIYTQWKSSHQRYPNCDLNTYEGREQLFRDYRQEPSQERDSFLEELSVDGYFDQDASKEQVLRDQIEIAYFEENRALSLMSKAQKIFDDKKQEEVETALTALIDNQNYQRWLQLRYRCGLDEAKRRALDDYLRFYKKDFASQQPSQSQGSLFPRFEQVIQNSLYDAKSYAQGWIGYTAAATIFSVAYGIAHLLKTAQKTAQEQASADQLRATVLEMNDATENDALSYVLLTVRDHYGQNLSQQEKEQLNAIITRRQERFPDNSALINTQDLTSYKNNNPSFTDWVDAKLRGCHLSCQTAPLEVALGLYQDLYKTHVLSKALQQQLTGQELDVISGVSSEHSAQELTQLFFNNPMAFLQHHEKQHGAQSAFVDESFGIINQKQHQTVSELFDNHQKIAQDIVQGSQSNAFYDIPMGAGRMLAGAAIEIGQQFVTLQHRYLTGDKQGPASGEDGMSEEVKRNLAARRAPRPGQQ